MRIIKRSWPVDALFSEVQRRARYSDQQMFHTFNVGIGMILIMKRVDIKQAQNILSKSHISSWAIGTVKQGTDILVQ